MGGGQSQAESAAKAATEAKKAMLEEQAQKVIVIAMQRMQEDVARLCMLAICVCLLFTGGVRVCAHPRVPARACECVLAGHR